MPSRRRIRRRHGQEQQGRGSCACSGSWQQLSVPCSAAACSIPLLNRSSKLATAHEEEVPEFLYASAVAAAIADVAAGKSVALSEEQAGNRRERPVPSVRCSEWAIAGRTKRLRLAQTDKFVN
ncbi:unnamed protein product [Urochloa humidicola]